MGSKTQAQKRQPSRKQGMQKMLGGMTVLRVRSKYWAALTSQKKCDDRVHGSWPQEAVAYDFFLASECMDHGPKAVAHDSFLEPECISTSLTQRQQMRSLFFKGN